MKTLYSIMSEVVVRGTITTTVSTASGLFTDTMLANWTDQAHRWAAAYKPWPFTEGRQSTTFTGAEEWTFESLKSDSIRLAQIGGCKLDKLNFDDYQIFKEENSGTQERICTDFGRVFFVNPNIDLSGTLTVWGQYQPAAWSDVTDVATSSIFADSEDEGNEAVVQEALSYVKTREGKIQEGMALHKNSIALLENLWKRMSDEAFTYHGKNRGIFERVDILSGDYYSDQLDTDQF